MDHGLTSNDGDEAVLVCDRAREKARVMGKKMNRYDLGKVGGGTGLYLLVARARAGRADT